MALGTNHVVYDPTQTAGSRGEAETFVPELWSDDVVAAYKSNLVVAPLVINMNHTGKKGSTVHVPKPVRGDASQKSPEAQVTLIANTEQELVFNIDQHWEYSRLIEDIVTKQALPSLRRFYTDDAGYALAKRIDTALHTRAAGFGQTSAAYDGFKIGGDGTTAWDPAANANTGNGSSLDDDGIRTLLQALDDADVPMNGRFFIIPPVEKKKLLGIQRFTEQAFVGEVGGANSIRNGLIGDLYGTPVYVSTNVPTVLADDASTPYRPGVLAHKDSMVLFTQMAPRVQSQYKLEYLGDLFTADVLFGTGIMRDEGGIGFMVPNS